MKRAGWEPSYLFPRVLCLCQLEKHSQSRAKEGLGLELLLFQGTTSLVLRHFDMSRSSTKRGVCWWEENM